MRDEMERVVPLRVLDIRVGAVGDEELDDIEVAASGCPLHGCCDKVTAECVDFGALFEKVATCR